MLIEDADAILHRFRAFAHERTFSGVNAFARASTTDLGFLRLTKVYDRDSQGGQTQMSEFIELEAEVERRLAILETDEAADSVHAAMSGKSLALFLTVAAAIVAVSIAMVLL